MTEYHYLIIDDDALFAETLARSLARRGLAVTTAAGEREAMTACRAVPPDRVILDLKLEDTSGLRLITKLRQQAPGCRIVMLTGYSSIPTTVEAIKLGATDYLCKPATATAILAAFDKDRGNPDVDLADSPHSIDRLQWEHIQRVLAEHDGNISATARALGMHRRTLQRRLQKRPVRN